MVSGAGVVMPFASEDRGDSGLLTLTSSWRDIQQTRMALQQRGLDAEGGAMLAIEERIGREIAKRLRQHVVWPWLAQYPGHGGLHTATLIALIDDPRRFPGQQCSVGHTMEPDHEVGSPCPAVGKDDETCPGAMLAPRTTTGVRSLWHYLGLHVVDGKLPKRRKGQQATWNPKGRLCVLQPGGIAEHIVRSRVPKYRDLYDQQKARLTEERAADPLGSAVGGGALLDDGAEVGTGAEVEPVIGLRPIQIDKIARTIAAKAFVGDLLTTWKGLVGNGYVDEGRYGEALP